MKIQQINIITCIPKNKIDVMINIFNSYDESLKFTYETETNHNISFLDIINQDGKLIIDWYKNQHFLVDLSIMIHIKNSSLKISIM